MLQQTNKSKMHRSAQFEKRMKFPGQPTRSRRQLHDGPLAPMRPDGPRRAPPAGRRGQFCGCALVLVPTHPRVERHTVGVTGGGRGLVDCLARLSPSPPLSRPLRSRAFPLCSLRRSRPPDPDSRRRTRASKLESARRRRPTAPR